MRRASDFRNLTRRERRRLLLRAILRPLVTVFLCTVVYFALPWTSLGEVSALLFLAGGLLVVALVAGWQIWRIVESDVPALQAIEALALILPLYLLGFSAGYCLMSESDPGYFTEPLTRMGALYFSLTIFSTVGFGDIAATTDPSRAVVSVQIIGNLILLGVGIRAVVAAVDWARRRRV
ncbi:two pore domain potassium channel family protein [Rhodococcus sp. IEGM 248]|uniref:ion channel n=1 Tax=Rhodococcus opacus TaxID=37919 RepID=UPI0013C189AC|nr:potassium channel family protein [Rhodococcus opacus]MDV7090702.1 potassium channel family protein [Rhodococcus opacus]NDV04715.1 two pore domain potassium channel family protein [Rhodococcus sp. IEGM 248]